jgi:hypothetical protein
MPVVFPLSEPENFTPCGLIELGDYLSGIILTFSGLTAVAAIVWGGIKIITSGGSEEGVASGKNIVKWAIVGLVVIIFARVFVSQTLRILQARLPDCEKEIMKNQ